MSRVNNNDFMDMLNRTPVTFGVLGAYLLMAVATNPVEAGRRTGTRVPDEVGCRIWTAGHGWRNRGG